MQLSIRTPRCLLLTALLAMGLTAGSGAPAVGAGSRSGCVVCHTDENALVRTLSKVKPKKSAMTAGAG